MTPQTSSGIRSASPSAPAASAPVPRGIGSRTANALGVDALLTPAEVASLFRVDPKTVTRWANAGKITTVRTLGGHRRFSQAEIRSLLGAVPGQRLQLG